MRILVLGCKDFPPFANAGDVGGIEVFCDGVFSKMKKHRFYVISRRYPRTKKRELFENLVIYRVPFVDLPLLKTVSFNFFAFFKSLTIKNDLIWAHEPTAGFFAYLLKKLKGFNYILHIHSKGSLEPGVFFRRYGLKLLEYFAYKNPTKTIFVSKNLKKEISREGYVVPIGVDIEKFRRSLPLGILNTLGNKKILCYVGRLSYVKGIDNLIKAFYLLEHQNIILLIVGSGEEKRKLKKLVKNLSLKDSVLFLENQKVERILPFVDLFILPSYSEGLPHSILEAIASGIPVVASAVGDIPYILDKQYLVKPRDILDLKNKINFALKNQIIQILDEEFLIDNVVNKLNKIIRA